MLTEKEVAVSMNMKSAVVGECRPEFQQVRTEFERNFAERDEVGASVTVTVDGETVVDLWGGIADPQTDRPWERDTRVVAFSSTKGATALCAHLLVDRGLLDLDAPVGQYWPEFATNGKEQATVSMMLDHSVGVPALSGTLAPGEMYDWDAMCARLAAQRPWWEPGTRNGYHMMTYGWIVGELVRRVSGRSLGTFFREEVAGPLGAEFDIGLPEELEENVAPVIAWTPDEGYDTAFFRAIADPATMQGRAMANIVDAGVDFNTRAAHAAEIGAAGGIASSQGLATIYRELATGGLVRPDTLARMGETAVATSVDAMFEMPSRFALGFMKSMDNRRRVGAAGTSAILSSGAFGHFGAGGSIGFADPAARMSFGYVMNRHGEGVLLNDRGQSLVDATYRALGYRTDAPGVWVP